MKNNMTKKSSRFKICHMVSHTSGMLSTHVVLCEMAISPLLFFTVCGMNWGPVFFFFWCYMVAYVRQRWSRRIASLLPTHLVLHSLCAIIAVWTGNRSLFG